MKNRFALLLTLLLAASVAMAAERPRLVVNVVVSGARMVDLERYEEGLRAGGFERLLSGRSYPYAYYSFAPSTPSALAALSTGAAPSLSGVIGSGWWNNNNSSEMLVVEDAKCSTFNADNAASRVSNANLTLETIGDVVVREIKGGKSVSVAADASSAIILGGLHPTEVWWIDSLGGRWTTSTKYKTTLPRWVDKYNASGFWRSRMGEEWVLSRTDGGYVNEHSLVAKPYGYKPPRNERDRRPTAKDVRELLYAPISNDMVADFAKETIIYNRLGGDKATDVLNVCFDSPRRIAARYGLRSREVEDMYYRLDEALADLMTFASAQAGGKVLFVFSTDGGVREVESVEKVFNTAQARFLVNSFLSATYGKGDWVLGYRDGGLWLNHTLIFSHGLDLAALQRQVGTFMLGLRGASHAFTASEMMDGSVKEGVAAVVREGFYPKRSADIHLVLMPDWCEVAGEGSVPKVTTSQPYAPYRRAVVALSGMGVEQGVSIRERVDVRSLVVTLAEMLGVEAPLGAEGESLVQNSKFKIQN